MEYRIKAVVLTRGTSLETEGPGLSAFMMCIFCPPDRGTKAIMKTSTPMPPTQWVKLRHMSIHLGRGSTAVRMEAPVVVKPETVSKTAST